MLEDAKQRLQQLIDAENSEKVGLTINVDKSKSMFITSSPLVLQSTGAFNRLKPIKRSSKYPLRLKLFLINGNVLFILFYARQGWKMNQQFEKKILAFEDMCLRRILNIRSG